MLLSDGFGALREKKRVRASRRKIATQGRQNLLRAAFPFLSRHWVAESRSWVAATSKKKEKKRIFRISVSREGWRLANERKGMEGSSGVVDSEKERRYSELSDLV